jgi:integrase
VTELPRNIIFRKGGMVKMKKGENINRPRKGDNITVDPIRSIKDIRAIAKMLSDSPRNHLLFTMGVNNGLRTGDLLKLRVGDVKNLKVGDMLTIREGKTGKSNILVMNKSTYGSLQAFLEKVNPSNNDPLFASRKGEKPITVQCVNSLMKKWATTINLKGNYGAHSLRKTWGYIQRTIYGVGFEVICRRYNHSSPATTMRYLGITDKEIKAILMNDVL